MTENNSSHYMASYKNKTGPICKKIKDAAKEFFKKYPQDDICYVAEGESCGNNIFIAKFRGVANEVRREQVF